jgi:hypothetical protein
MAADVNRAATAVTQMNCISGCPNIYQQKNITSTSNHYSAAVGQDDGIQNTATSPMR